MQGSPSERMDAVGYYDEDISKKKKGKKIRMRIKMRRPRRDSDDRGGREVTSPRYQEFYGEDGGFQLDNVTPSMRPPTPKSVQRGVDGGDDSNKRFRVKPHHAFPSPVFLNETELYQHMMAPSEEFEFLTSYLNPSTKATRRARVPEAVRRVFGSPREDGRIGSLRVEVLGCVGLDRSKPEVSVYLVAGDCAFSTDVIPGARSPMWPNSSQRAAVFPLHHAYARLFVGVFDLKARKSSEADHFCGRVAIDLPPLRPNTEYDVTFPLRVSSFVYDRRPRGVVRLRFSLHWFSERAAILSYLKRPRNPLAYSKQAKKQPTIPCGDPKTFRNVAVTVHGQDFPGKYSRGAFRATMREFNLYQQNLRFLSKVTLLDCILYENPLMSLYLFGSSQYCVWRDSVRLVPPFFVGWLIYMLVENYINHCATQAGHLGYKPLSILEVFYGLIKDGRDKDNGFCFEPILVKKRARKQVTTEDGKARDIELANHREFPFSERFEYPKFPASDALAPSPASKNKKGKGSSSELEKITDRRLSIYTAPDGDEVNSDESEDDDASSEEERDTEGMMDEGDDGYLEDSDEESVDYAGGKGRLFESGKASTTRRIRAGPPQNSDTRGRKVPPQVHLSKVEHMLQRATKNISVEHVHFPPPHIQANLEKESNAKGPAGDIITAKERQNFDEFDKLLGFRSKNPNPILRITSSFLGPLMRIIRIAIYATRIAFNVTAWRDPFLTFWAFTFLCLLVFVLLIMPWRWFFFAASIVLLGPQNIAVRKFLERRAAEKERDEKDAKARAKFQAEAQASMQGGTSPNSASAYSPKEDASLSKDKKKKKWGWKKVKEEDEEELTEVDLYHSPRPAFFAHSVPTKRTAVPRDVAVPYFRFRKDRFYDWPPDPTVSRATPIFANASETRARFDSTGSSFFPEYVDGGFGNSEGIRRRHNARPSEEDYR